jgi:hypothetical protein
VKKWRGGSCNQFADWAIEELERIPVSLPEAREAFRARAQNHAERQGAFREPEDVDALLASAGLNACERFEIAFSDGKPDSTHSPRRRA